MPFEIDPQKVKELSAAEDPSALVEYLKGVHDAEVGGLVRKRDELLDTVTKLKPQLEPWQKLGKSPEEIAAELAEVQKIRDEAAAKSKGVDSGELEKLVEERVARKITGIQGEWTAKLTEAQQMAAEREELATKLAAERDADRLQLHLIRTSHENDFDVYPEAWGDFSSYVKRYIQWDERGVPSVVDPDSGVKLTGQKGDMTLPELVERVYRERPFYFKARGQGSPLGSRNNSRGGSQLGRKRSEMTDSQKSQFIEQHGQEAFQQLPA